MNILITGIHGFVGTNLTNALKSSHTIYGIDIVSPIKDGVEHTFKWSELYQLPSIDIVIHLAGIAHDTKNQTETKKYFDVNTGLTQKIFDWFISSAATKFIYFSSTKAAADKVSGNILYEDVTPAPIGPYGESKIAAEHYILAQNAKLSPEKKIYILRPCMIHGPGNKGNLNLLYNFVKKGIPYPLGAFKNNRSFTSIDNLSFLINELINQQTPSGIYNIADDETISTNELITIISKTLNKPVRILKLNANFVNLVATLGSKLHLPLNKDRLQKLTENYVVSNKKIKHALNIEKLPINATDGIKKTILSFIKK